MKLRTVYLSHQLSTLNLKDDSKHPIVTQIHKLLTVRGLYHGPVHDIYDTCTREAIACFQEAEGLPATGIMDPITYCRLHQANSIQIAPAPSANRANSALARANILITKSQRQLTLFDGNTPIRQYPVGIGKPNTPSPLGNYTIVLKVMNPGGVLGTRWLGLNFDSYGIHGTNKPWLIGQMVSLGCIRMLNNNVEELYHSVNVGTPVYIRD